MSKGKELIKNTGIIFLGKFCTQFISFLLVPIYTTLLSTSDYGYIDLIQTYISLLVPIIILRFDTGIFRFLIDSRSNEDRKKVIISSIVFLILLQMLISGLVCIILSNYLTIKYIYLILINVFVTSLSSVFLQLARGLGRNISYSIASVISGITTVLCNVLFIAILKYNASFILVSSAVGNLLCIIYLMISNKIIDYINIKHFNKKQLKEILKYSLPMIPDGLSWWITNVSDRTLIAMFLGTSFNGIYSISCKFSNVLSNFFQIFNMTWQENASLYIKEDDRDVYFSNILNQSIKFLILVCCTIMSVMPLIYKYLIGIEYISSYTYIPFLLLANIINAVANIIGAVYIAKKKTNEVSKTTMLGASVNIFVNVILIRSLKLWAAVISTIISYVVMVIYRYLDSKKYVNFKFDKKLNVQLLLLYSFCILLYYYNNIALSIINFIIMIIIVFIYYKDNLFKLLKKLKKGHNHE